MQTFTDLEREGWGRNAGGYDKLVMRATRQAFAPILGQLGDVAGKTVVDLACRTGHLAGMLAERGARTSAVDFAPEMVTLAKSRVRDVQFIEADCERLIRYCSIRCGHLLFRRAALRAVGRCFCGSGPCPQAGRAVCFHGMEKPCRRWSLPWFNYPCYEKFADLLFHSHLDRPCLN